METTSAKQDIPVIHFLSLGQERLWFIQQLHPEDIAYNLGLSLCFQGKFHADAFLQTLETIFEHHETFRTTYSEADGKPIALIFPTLKARLEINDYSGQQPIDIKETIHQELNKLISVPFKMSELPLFRYKLLRFNDDLHYFIFCTHHIIMDGTSYYLFLQNIADIYSAHINNKPSPLPAISTKFSDFIQAQRFFLQKDEYKQLLSYWKNQLANLQQLELPTDYPRTSKTPIIHIEQNFLTHDLVARLEQFCKDNNKSVFSVLFSAFYSLLYRYTEQTDFCIGVPTHGRLHGAFDDMIGFFVNVLPFRIVINPNTNFKELLDIVKKTTREALLHQEVILSALISELNLSRTIDRDPIYQVMFEYDNTHLANIHFDRANMTLVEAIADRSPYDIVVEAHHSEGTLNISWKYDSCIFNRSTIVRMINHWMTLLESALANPKEKLSLLPLLSSQEKQQIVYEWNQTQARYPDHLTIHQWVEQQADKTPNAVAIVFNEIQLTYLELNEKANQLAHYLRTLAIQADNAIAICLDRSPQLIIGILAILKSGAAYLPLDLHHPKERLLYMLKDANAIALITDTLNASIFSNYTGTVVLLKELNDELDSFPKTNPEPISTATNLAYIIYTSGSTGAPKGTLINHRGLCNLSHWYHKKFNLTSEDRASQFASPAFDAYGCEIWPFLTAGSSVWIIPQLIRYVPEELKKWMLQNHITITDLPTVIAESLLAMPWPCNPSLRILKIGGEKIRCYPIGKYPFEVWNTYGPTETTIECLFARINEPFHTMHQSPPIGTPINNCLVYILDEFKQPVPIGVAGELYLSGAGLARGYLNQSELTLSKFVNNPFHTSLYSHMYKTGDICRWMEDGCIEFIKRRDDQIKIRGHRIELGEIEFCLNKHPAIKQCIVLVDDNPLHEKKLIAYWIPVIDKQKPSQKELHDFLQTELPDYMIPADFVLCDQFPVTATGKLDKYALLSHQTESRQDSVKPLTLTECKLANLWTEVLNIKQISMNDNFFILGGHSLSLMQLLVKINKVFQTNLTVDKIFQNQTLREQSIYLESYKTHKNKPSCIVKLNECSQSQSLICLHPVGGSVICYKKLAELLKDRYSVYGIQTTTEPCFKTLENISEYYVSQIKSIQPHGPYAILGWSTGGLLAFEMARQFNMQQDKIALLAMIDTSNPSTAYSAKNLEIKDFYYHLIHSLTNHATGSSLKLMLIKKIGLSLRHFGFLLSLAGIKKDTIDYKQLKVYVEALRNDLTGREPDQFPLDAWISFLKKNHFIPAEIENKQLHEIYKNLRTHFLATEEYRPGYYNGKIIYFEMKKPINPNTWISHCQTLETIRLPANHYSVMQDDASLIKIVQSIGNIYE